MMMRTLLMSLEQMMIWTGNLRYQFTVHVKENANAAVEELLEFRTDLPLDESLKMFTQVTSKRIKQASLAPVILQSEEELENKFYKELEKAEFFIAIQERFIQKSRRMVQENQTIDIGEFLADMITEYENLKK